MTNQGSDYQWFSFPEFDPIAIAIGPLAIRWYAIAYMAGLLGGWYILRRLARHQNSPVTTIQLDSLLNWVLFGVIIGGRLGYVLFYKPLAYLGDPLSIIRVWEGGMSFHGGFLGVVLAVYLFAKRHKVPLAPLSDRIALVAPLGLLFGRLANFINGELYGRITTHPIGIIFPNGGALPRHPSQLYEAGLEGLLLGLVMMMAWRAKWHDRYAGIFAGLFLTGYGTARFIVEYFREPDSHIGLYEFMSLSHGQLLSLPMIVLGVVIMARIFKKQAV